MPEEAAAGIIPGTQEFKAPITDVREGPNPVNPIPEGMRVASAVGPSVENTSIGGAPTGPEAVSQIINTVHSSVDTSQSAMPVVQASPGEGGNIVPRSSVASLSPEQTISQPSKIPDESLWDHIKAKGGDIKNAIFRRNKPTQTPVPH